MKEYSYSAIIEISKKEQLTKILDGTYWIGRSEECDIILRINEVSRRHAKMTLMPPTIEIPYSYYVIRDNDSSNGTWIGGENIKNIRDPQRKMSDKIIKLQDKDIITFGTGRYYPTIIFLMDAEKIIITSENETCGEVFQ